MSIQTAAATAPSSSPAAFNSRPPAPVATATSAASTTTAVVPFDAPFERMDRPEEADYKWAQDSYSSLQRTADTWAFFTRFRTQLYFLDQKWSYIGAWGGGYGRVRGLLCRPSSC